MWEGVLNDWCISMDFVKAYCISFALDTCHSCCSGSDYGRKTERLSKGPNKEGIVLDRLRLWEQKGWYAYLSWGIIGKACVECNKSGD